THNPWTWGALNSSSILEPVVRQYWLTGEKKYLDFASYIVKRGGSKWGNIYKVAIEGKKAPYEYPVTKAYEATSFFEGVLEYYRATGDEDAKAAYINFMAKVVETDLTVIGCSGCTHELFDHSSLVQTEVNDEVKQETCVTVTLMKAFYQALCLTGEAKYAEAMERSGYNAMLGAVNFNKLYSFPNDKGSPSDREFVATAPFVRLIEGFTFDSYSPLYKDKRARRIGGFKVMPGGTSYGCCACIGASGIAVMPISSVMLSKNGLTVNHYMNGTFTAGGVTLEMKTKYPYGEKISIKIHTGAPVSFALSLRIPSETIGRATVDGKVAEVNKLGYATIEREWCDGDTVEIVIPREFTTMRLNGKICVIYGAIVMALDERNQDINVKVTDKITGVEPITASFPTREAYKITFSNGVSVNAVDYASAGAEWDKPNCNVTAWIDEE
ncbi:MAG: glycoside hydrolase family 127 protein, partial [Clostridia bacterium]|nr:glycoside hydrolase family 127 protein [Clostridia bacterium]